MQDLLYKRYRPKTLDEYIFTNENVKTKALEWIENKIFPNILFYGPSGTGKSSLAKLLVDLCDIDQADVLEVHASGSDRKADVIEKIEKHCMRSPLYSKYNVIILDEADRMSDLVYDSLKNLTEEFTYATRFIMTCNNVNRIPSTLQSRFKSYAVETMDKQGYATRLATILSSEGIKYDAESVLYYINSYYPDMRKALMEIESNSINNVLTVPDEEVTFMSDWMKDAIAHFSLGNIRDGREIICKHIQNDDYDDFYRMMYENLEWFGDTNEQKDKAVLIIKEALVDDTRIADREINISACLTKLNLIRNIK